MAITSKSTTGFTETFKIKFGGYSSAVFYTGGKNPDPFQAIIPKEYDILASREGRKTIRTTMGGSVGFSALPNANPVQHIEIKLNSYKQYARMNIDNETLAASEKQGAAYMSSMKLEVDSKVLNYTRWVDLTNYNDGTAVLGQWTGQATGTAAAPIVTINATVSANNPYGFRPFYFEEDDEVQVEKDVTGTPVLQTDTFRITAVNTTTGAITLARIGTTTDLTAAGFGSQSHNLVLYRSSRLDTSKGIASGVRRVPMGLLGIKANPSGLYGLPGALPRRFSSTTTARAGAVLTPDTLSNDIIEFNRFRGVPCTHIITSIAQQKILVAQAEGRKDYTMNSTFQGVPNRVSPFVMGVSAIKIESPAQPPVNLVASRFLRDDMVVLMANQEHHQSYVDDPQWLSRDGNMLDRLPDDDGYEARFGGYWENYLHPFYFHFIDGLSTSV